MKNFQKEDELVINFERKNKDEIISCIERIKSKLTNISSNIVRILIIQKIIIMKLNL